MDGEESMEGRDNREERDWRKKSKRRESLGSFQTVEDFWSAHERAETHEEVAGVLHGGWTFMFPEFNARSGFAKGDPDVVRLFLEYAERGYGSDRRSYSEEQADFIVFFKLLPHFDFFKVVYTAETEGTLMLLLQFFQRIVVPKDNIVIFGFTPFHSNDRRLKERAVNVGKFLNFLERTRPSYGSKELQEMWEVFHGEVDQTIICLGILVPEMWERLACFIPEKNGAIRILEEIALGTFSYPFGGKQIPVFPNTLMRYNSLEEAIRRDPDGLQGRAAYKAFSLRHNAEEMMAMLERMRIREEQKKR